MPTSLKHKATGSVSHRIAFGVSLVLAFCVSWYFHDKFWWGPDDGFFAYISQRMLEGDVVHKDIQAFHPGLLYFVNSAFLKLSAGDPVGLRYPLIALTVIQTGLAYKITAPQGRVTALTASFAMIAFGFVQFVNPTPNWYLVTLTIALGAYLMTSDLKANRTLLWIGAVVGLAFLFRQLTGVFLAFGVTAIVFLMNSDATDQPKQRAGTILLGVIAVCMAIFVFKTAQIAGLLLFGLAPILILLSAAYKSNLGWATVTRIVPRLFLGAILVATPLILYHAITGSFAGFINETFIAPFTFFEVPLVDQASYFALLFFPVSDLAAGNFMSIFSLIFWIMLLICNLLLSALVVKNMSITPTKPIIFGTLVIFHSLVALIYEIPIYLFYTTGLIFVALLMFDFTPRIRAMGMSIMALTAVFALVSHAGQPLDRTYQEIALGKRVSIASHALPSSKIRTNEATATFYARVIEAVETCSQPSDRLFAYPLHPEIYFLTQRQSVFKFLNSTFGITPTTNIDPFVDTVKTSDQPALILHNTVDKHNTVYSDRFFAAIAPLYVSRGQIDDLTLYQRLGHNLAPTCQLPASVKEER